VFLKRIEALVVKTDIYAHCFCINIHVVYINIVYILYAYMDFMGVEALLVKTDIYAHCFCMHIHVVYINIVYMLNILILLALYTYCMDTYVESESRRWYGIATVSSIDKIIGIFCRILSLL